MVNYFDNFFDSLKKQEKTANYLDEWANEKSWNGEAFISEAIAETNHIFNAWYAEGYQFGIINTSADLAPNKIDFYFYLKSDDSESQNDCATYCGDTIYAEVTGTLIWNKDKHEVQDYRVEWAQSNFALGEDYLFEPKPYNFLKTDFKTHIFKNKEPLLNYLMSISSCPTYLFRGHRIFDWQLYPSATRERDCTKSQKDLLQQRRTHLKRNLMFLDPNRYRIMNNDEWLFFLQHRGIPTPLLDFSSSIWVALYFAVCDKNRDDSDDSDACIWVIKPNGPLTVANFELKQIDPPYYDLQMRTQKSNFINFSPTSDINLKNNYEDIEKGIFSSWNAQKIIIDKGLKISLRKYLSNIGLKKSDIFPTVSNIVEEVLKNKILHR